ncbi:MAG: hypothetical protein Crog4KO_05880 [Crocinitomicaceae bacterium]
MFKKKTNIESGARPNQQQKDKIPFVLQRQGFNKGNVPIGPKKDGEPKGNDPITNSGSNTEAIRSIDEDPLLSLIDDSQKNANKEPGSYWRSVSSDSSGTGRSPFDTRVKYNQEIREQTSDRFKEYPQEEEALFYKLVNNEPQSKIADKDVHRVITAIDLKKESGEAYTAWYELTYSFGSDNKLRSRSYVFLYESAPETETDVQSGDDILKTAKETTVPKSNDVRRLVKTGTRYGKTYPVDPKVDELARQQEYFETDGGDHLEIISRFVEIKYEAYKWEYRRVMRENRSKRKDDKTISKEKKANREAIKNKKFNRLVDSSGTLFMVEIMFKEYNGPQQDMMNKEVEVDEINVMYLGSSSAVDKETLPSDFSEKDKYVHWTEKLENSMGAVEVKFKGFDELSETIRNQEQYFLLQKANTMFKNGMHSNEIDLAVPVNYNKEGEDPNYELVYYTFLSHKIGDKGVQIDVTRIGKANDPNAAYGDAEVLRLRDIYGYSETFSKEELVTFLSKRYNSMKPLIENLDTKDEVLAIAEKHLLETSGTKDWFKTNYQIDVWNASEKMEDAIALLRKRYRYDSRSSGRKVHEEVSNNDGSETDGLKDWTAAELRYLEMSLQKFSSSLLKHLSGINYMRQVDCLLYEHYKSPSGITHHHPSYNDTVIIYDKAFKSSGNSIPKEQYAFRGSEEEVSSAHTGTPTHETGHVIQNLGSKGDTNGDRFHYFYSKIVNGPEHGFESVGITPYARGELNKDANSETIKKNEYFPEAFDLFMHDPEGLYRARPKVYMWFAHLQSKGRGPSAQESQAFVNKWMDFKASQGNPRDEITSLTFIE